MLRDLGVSILESEGFRVLAAKDGVEAVALFEANSDEIGLVVCDLGLPRLGGREAFLKMKESKPGVRAIVASGYLEPTIRSEMLKAGVIDTIQKPYDFNDLLAKIRSVIGPEDVPDDHPGIVLTSSNKGRFRPHRRQGFNSLPRNVELILEHLEVAGLYLSLHRHLLRLIIRRAIVPLQRVACL